MLGLLFGEVLDEVQQRLGVRDVVVLPPLAAYVKVPISPLPVSIVTSDRGTVSGALQERVIADT